MKIYTLEIENRSIAVFNGDTQDEAEEFATSTEFTTDLMAFETTAGALWDGETPLVVREASIDERAKWEASRAEGIAQGEADEDDAMWVVFLVTVVDPDSGLD